MIMIIDTDDFTPADVNFLADTLHNAFNDAPCDKGDCSTCSHATACNALYKLTQFWLQKAAEGDHV